MRKVILANKFFFFIWNVSCKLNIDGIWRRNKISRLLVPRLAF